MTLEEKRRQWEGEEPNVIAERVDRRNQQALVVVKDDDKYRCIRYFAIGDNNWEVSVDGDQVSAETVIKWLCSPSAMTCRKAENPEDFED